MSTYSIYNLKIDNDIRFQPGITAGYVLSINADGTTDWVQPATGGTGGGASMLVDFIASTTSPTSLTTVTFSNLSDPTPVHNFWEFSDGAFSTASQVSRLFAGGSYSVTLNACVTQSGGIEQKLNYITSTNDAPLDTIVGATAAYSTRLLRLGYTGFCMRVRRSNDNATQDIGFVNGQLDTASLLSFVGANTGFVIIWYDQSGAGNNITAANNLKNPRIVNSGVLETLNGNPSPFWQNAQGWQMTLSASGKTFDQPFGISAVCKLTAGSGINASILFDSQPGSGDRAIFIHKGTTEAPNNTGQYGAATLKTVETSTANARVYGFYFEGTYSYARLNGSQVHSGASDSPGTQSLLGLTLGGLRGDANNNYDWSGQIAEFIIWNYDISGTASLIDTALNTWWNVY